MTRKMMKIFAVMMACMMVLLVSAVSFAEEAPVDIFAMEAPAAEAPAQEEEAPVEDPAPAEDPAPVEETVEEPVEEPAPVEEPVPAEEPAPIEEPTPAEEPVADDDDDLVEIDDDWGYVSRELIEQHTPEMTQEFIHADDPDWVPEGEEKTETEEPVHENAPEMANGVTETEEEEPAEVTEETEKTEETEGTEETEETEETTEETEGTEETEETEETSSDVVVKVTASMRSENLMHLKAHIEDPNGNDYNYQWQVSVDGGENYEDVEDAEEDFFDVELDEENVSNLWRVKVHAV